jgi:cyclopropane fatty-acyl-phospholipid synthase-like methyltransferase
MTPLLVALLLSFPENIPAKYLTCRKDGDCAVIPPGCSPAVAVNRRYLEAARKLDDRACLTAREQSEPKAVCRARRCELAPDGPGLGLGHKFTHAKDFVKAFDDPARDEWQKPQEVMARLELEPGMTVADIGAGTGYFERYLSLGVGLGGKVLALDVEPDMVRHLGERAKRDGLTNVIPKQVAHDDPGLAPQSVDRVLIVNTWHHIADRERYAGKLAAALVKGGRVVIVDYTLDSPSGPPKQERIPPEKVAQELAAGGLEPEIVVESLPRQYIVVGKVRPARSR